MKILIMGLSGSGKTYLSEKLAPLLNAAYFNADQIRKITNDWDFTLEGRHRQAHRMRHIAEFEANRGRMVVCDFICPTEETRQIFQPDFIVWMDTVKSSNYQDTDAIFEKPSFVDVRIKEWHSDSHRVVAKCVWQKLGDTKAA